MAAAQELTPALGAGAACRALGLWMRLSDARTVMAQMKSAFGYFNEVHPHSRLKMKSPTKQFGQ